MWYGAVGFVEFQIGASWWVRIFYVTKVLRCRLICFLLETGGLCVGHLGVRKLNLPGLAWLGCGSVVVAKLLGARRHGDIQWESLQTHVHAWPVFLKISGMCPSQRQPLRCLNQAQIGADVWHLNCLKWLGILCYCMCMVGEFCNYNFYFFWCMTSRWGSVKWAVFFPPALAATCCPLPSIFHVLHSDVFVVFSILFYRTCKAWIILFHFHVLWQCGQILNAVGTSKMFTPWQGFWMVH